MKNKEIVFKEVINKLFKDSGLTQQKTATAIGVELSQFQRWLYGQAIPTTWSLIAISDFYEVTIDELLFGIIEK